MEAYRFYMAGEKLYHYFWHTFADRIIEESKIRINGKDEKKQMSAKRLLFEMLSTQLKAFHPFMPFITEEIWSKLPLKEKKVLMIEEWPTD